MANYIVKRVLGAIRCFSASPFWYSFSSIWPLPPLRIWQGEKTPPARPPQAALEANLGLDKPLPVRYLLWLGELLTGDLGQSYRTGQPVLDMVAQRVVPSLILTGTGVAAAVLIGIPLGVMAAWKPHSRWSKLAGGLTF